MSASPDNAAVAYCSPVAGLTMAVVRPSAASTYSPLMKFLNAFMRRSPCCRGDGVVVACSLHCEGRFDLDLSDYGTQHELALGPGDTTLSFQPADERIEAARADTVDDHRVVRRPGDVQRQLDLIPARQPGLELGRITAGGQADVDHRSHITAQRRGIDAGPVVADHTGGFQPPDAVGHGAGRHVHRFCEITPADPAVLLQKSDDSAVDVIDCHHLFGHYAILP